MANGVIYCNHCGEQNAASARFCANCGTSFSAEPQAPPSGATTPVFVPPAQEPAWQAVAPVQYPPFPAIRYAGFWIRFVAFIIDAIAVTLVIVPIAAVIGLALGIAGGAVTMPDIGVHLVRGIVGFTFSTCAHWIYEAVLESSSYQATLGKMALGLKVTDLEGRRISFARATARHFSKILSGMILFIGFIMIGFTERKQGLHDMIAGTLVIRAR